MSTLTVIETMTTETMATATVATVTMDITGVDIMRQHHAMYTARDVVTPCAVAFGLPFRNLLRVPDGLAA